jgi:precorrin-6B methylase 2
VPYRVDLARVPNDAAIDRLIDLGAIDVEYTADGVAALMPDAVGVGEISSLFGAAAVRVTPAVGRDDGSTWILRPRALIAGGIALVPAGSTAAEDALLLLDSDAFGTGRHPTTMLCLEAIREAVTTLPVPRVLDVGTGSGVLALAALKMGAARAVGVDLDAGAIASAAANADLNGLGPRLRLVRGDVRCLRGSWPLVVANILAASLVEMSSDLAPRVARGGRLVLSGVTAGLASEVERAYLRAGLRRDDIQERSGWAALVLQPTW